MHGVQIFVNSIKKCQSFPLRTTLFYEQKEVDPVCLKRGSAQQHLLTFAKHFHYSHRSVIPQNLFRTLYFLVLYFGLFLL